MMSKVQDEAIRDIIAKLTANPDGRVGYDLTYVGKQYTIQQLLDDLEAVITGPMT
jgi:hypothetical protein